MCHEQAPALVRSVRSWVCGQAVESVGDPFHAAFAVDDVGQLIDVLLRNEGCSLVQTSTSAPRAHQSSASWWAPSHGMSVS
jgi:NifU-like protein involved in Fe-S cluster formation